MKQLETIFVSPFKGVDINKMIEYAMEKNEDYILTLNKRQLDAGIDSDKESLGQYRNFKYKNRFKPVDLKLTGEFRRKFTLSKSKGRRQAEIFSQDEKAEKLEKKYGKDIYGLTDTSLKIAAETIKPDIQSVFLLSLIK